MALSAFDDMAAVPTDDEVSEVLQQSFELWIDLRAQIASHFDPLTEDWTFSGKKWGWSLRLKHKKRAVLYLTPTNDFFIVGFALGEKAVSAAHQGDLPESLLEVIDNAQKYAEGRAVRLEVRDAAGVENAVKLAEIKMSN